MVSSIIDVLGYDRESSSFPSSFSSSSSSTNIPTIVRVLVYISYVYPHLTQKPMQAYLCRSKKY